MTLTFYTNPMSRGRIVRWMLEEVGVPYDTVILDYASSMKDAAYLAVNPMGKVPAIIHDGKVVTEGAAICAYLAETFPDAGLAPTATERADYYRWMFYAAGPVEAAITNRSLGVVPTTDQQRMVGYGSYDTMVDTFEAAVSAHPYFTGDRFTAADVYAGSQVAWGVMFGSLPKRPVFDAYLGRITARDAYKRASAIDDALIPKTGLSVAHGITASGKAGHPLRQAGENGAAGVRRHRAPGGDLVDRPGAAEADIVGVQRAELDARRHQIRRLDRHPLDQAAHCASQSASACGLIDRASASAVSRPLLTS